MKSSIIFRVAVLAATCAALPTASVVVEKLARPPAGWIEDKSAELDKDATTITLQIHLANQNMDKFHDLAMNVRSTEDLPQPWKPESNAHMRT
jgi:hypothetical protein